MTPHRRWKNLTPLLTGLAFVGFAVGHACVEDGPEQADAWPERDVLGLSPAWLQGLPDPERSTLQRRLTQLAVEQAEDGAWTTTAPILTPDDPLGRTLVDIDAAREARGDAPLLVQWIDEEPQATTARACWLEPADLDEVAPATTDTLQWVIDPAFDDQPLAARTERDALEERLPRVQRWLQRCLDDAGVPPRADGLLPSARPTFELLRADGAPALLTVWPERRAILLNPLLLTLWDADRALPEPGFRTTAQHLTLDEIDGCVRDIDIFCNVCDTPAKVQQARLNDPNACTRQLFATGEVWDSCSKLNFEIAQGYYRYCLNSYMASFTGNGGAPTDVRGCMAAKTDTATGQDLQTTCDPRFVGTPEELSGAYLGFIRSTTANTCQKAFIDCAPKPQTPQNPNIGQDNGDCGDCEDCNSENAYGLDTLCDVDSSDDEEQ